ncbi:MAG: pirin family protein, partial [Candidatus Sumerlaeia bacterium]|nr:pirin family protein [Candidatus Sumerlaeia bacterium]
MTTPNTPLTLNVYPLNQQANGAFDGGRILESKPIGFPGEGSAVDRVGPLFYWAWAESKGPAVIGMHPHQGFEIVSYVLRGRMGHKDTLGTNREVGTGGIQVMQTASGVSHEEHMIGQEGTGFFQIWFEPNMRLTRQKRAVYADFEAAQIPTTTDATTGIVQRRYLDSELRPGSSAAFHLETDASLESYVIPAGRTLSVELPEGRGLAAVTVRGKAHYSTGGVTRVAEEREFTVVEARHGAGTIQVKAEGEVELMVVQVPLKVEY